MQRYIESSHPFYLQLRAHSSCSCTRDKVRVNAVDVGKVGMAASETRKRFDPGDQSSTAPSLSTSPESDATTSSGQPLSTGSQGAGSTDDSQSHPVA
jgi:hypothetical protein